jgi:hypothetical protein
MKETMSTLIPMRTAGITSLDAEDDDEEPGVPWPNATVESEPLVVFVDGAPA